MTPDQIRYDADELEKCAGFEDQCGNTVDAKLMRRSAACLRALADIITPVYTCPEYGTQWIKDCTVGEAEEIIARHLRKQDDQ